MQIRTQYIHVYNTRLHYQRSFVYICIKIIKCFTGEHSPTLSETATTARASSVNENGGTLNKIQNHSFDSIANNANIARNTQTLNRRTNNSHPLNNVLGTLPRVNNNNVSGGLLGATLNRKLNTGNHKKKSTQPIMAYDEIPGLQR